MHTDSAGKRFSPPAFLIRLLAMAMPALCGCSGISNPEPSRLYDGRYVGTRESNLLEACGITTATGRTAADIAGGNLRMQLFPGTKMAGTVGADGSLRASGLWKTPHGFHNFTVLRGKITGGLLTGTASDNRCTTEVALRKVGKR